MVRKPGRAAGTGLQREQQGTAGTPVRGGPSPLWLSKQMWAAAHATSMEAAIGFARSVRAVLWDWVGQYEAGGHYVAFTRDWAIVRRVLPLQVVLIVEQVLYDKGSPWRDLVGGFKPIKKGP